MSGDVQHGLDEIYREEGRAKAAARIEELRKGLFEARDVIYTLSNVIRVSDPACHSWAVRMLDRANSVLNHVPPA